MNALNITTTRPRLDITTTRARLEITNKMRKMSTRRTAPKMTVETTRAKFKVDWSRVWAESGRQSPSQLSSTTRQRSRRKVDQAIGRTVRNGDQMMAIGKYHRSDTPIVADIAWRDMISDNSVQTNVSSMPRSKPQITWDPGEVKINWSTGELHIEWDDNFMPDVSVTPHSVEIRLNGRSEVKISVDERNVARYSGRKVNKKV